MQRENYTSRSYKYQYLIYELPISSEVMDSFSDTRNPLNENLKNQIDLLKFELLDAVKEVIATELTPWQRLILRMYFFQNKTQVEIATELSCNQSSIAKNIWGSDRYVDGRYVGCYGGAIPKLKRICKTNVRILNILSELDDLYNSI